MKVCLRTEEGKYAVAVAATVKEFAVIDGVKHYLLFGGPMPVVVHDDPAGYRTGWKRELTKQERQDIGRTLLLCGVEVYSVRAV